jgi:hypothetical protein
LARFCAGAKSNALIDETMPIIVIAPYDRVFEKPVSNMQEVAARGGKIILVTDPQGAAADPSAAIIRGTCNRSNKRKAGWRRSRYLERSSAWVRPFLAPLARGQPSFQRAFLGFRSG